MSTYVGTVTPGALNWKVTVDGQALPPRHDLYNHSPDGLSWGYGGSGPAQLGLALLAHYYAHHGFTSPDTRALRYHQEFKGEWVAGLHMDKGWSIDDTALAPIIAAAERLRD